MQPPNSPPPAIPCEPPASREGLAAGALFQDPSHRCAWVWGLYEAATALASGNTRTTVSVAGRLTHFQRGDYEQVLGLLRAAVAARMCPTFPPQLIPGRAGSYSPIHYRHRRGGLW